MSSFAYNTLRLGLAITFVWIGVLIILEPVAWGSFVKPWAVAFLPLAVKDLMLLVGILDIVIGGFLFFNILTGLVSAVAAVHIVLILVTSGIDAVTVRDIGLLGAALALAIEGFRR